jgi:glycosyltransferase involved in cell wall biosynthesis
MSRPKVSIIIATKDRPEWVGRAVQSALSQTEPAIEVIVVDDGSREPLTLPIQDQRVRIERLERSGGPNAARNRGIGVARGEYVTFLDDDDVILPDYVADSLAGIRASTLPPPVAIMSPAQAVDPQGRKITVRGHNPPLPRGESRYVLRAGHRGRGFGNTLFIPTDVLRDIGGLDERLFAWETHDMLLQLDPVCSVDVIPTIGYHHTDHGGARQSKNVLDNGLALRLLVDKHAETFAKNRPMRADYMATAGAYLLKGGRWGDAVRATSRAVVIGRFRPKLIGLWLAALAGPRALALWRRIRPTRELPQDL